MKTKFHKSSELKKFIVKMGSISPSCETKIIKHRMSSKSVGKSSAAFRFHVNAKFKTSNELKKFIVKMGSISPSCETKIIKHRMSSKSVGKSSAAFRFHVNAKIAAKFKTLNELKKFVGKNGQHFAFMSTPNFKN